MDPQLKDDLPETREDRIDLTLGPVGSVRTSSGSAPGATLYVHLMTKGIRSVADIKLIWSWADGQKP